MADTTTTNYGLTKVEVGASQNTWGGKLNANADAIDSQMKVNANAAAAAQDTADDALAKTSNLSDLDDADTALSNLGGTNTGTAVFKATTAAVARTELGLGSASTQATSTFATAAQGALADTSIQPADMPAENNQTVWNTGTDSTQSTISASRLDNKIEDKLNISGSAPIFGVRAWVNFDGTGGITVNGSGNVASVTDNGTGIYTISFDTNMPSANYAVIGTCCSTNTSNPLGFVTLYTDSGGAPDVKSTSAVKIATGQTNTAAYTDFENISVIVVG